MKTSEALRQSYKEQFGIVNENYKTGVLLDSLVVTTEEMSNTFKETHKNCIEEKEAQEKVKKLRSKAKRIMEDLSKLTKRVS